MHEPLFGLMMKFALPACRSSLFAVALLSTALTAFANEGGGHGGAKKEEPKEEEKKIEYVKESGVEGRGGNLYKRVARDNKGTPELAPKLPPPPPPPKEEKEEKKDEGHGGGGDHGGGHEEPKKEEKKDKKEEKKKDDGGHGGGGDHGGGGHGGGHGGGEPAKKKPTPSKIYSLKIIKLDSNNRPLTEPMHTNKFADYFLCRDIIGTRYRDIVLSEMNTFADRMGLPRAQEAPCMIKIAKANTKLPGAVFIEFYVNEESARACIRGGECGSTRLMMLFPKDKTGKSPEEIYRSYVLTDDKKFRRAAFCVSPDGQFLGEKSCYVHLHPDWLFN